MHKITAQKQLNKFTNAFKTLKNSSSLKKSGNTIDIIWKLIHNLFHSISRLNCLHSKRAEIEDKSMDEYRVLMNSFKDENNYINYPDYYGGAFLDDNGRLVLQTADKSKAGIKCLQTAAGDDNIEIQAVPYSYNELLKVRDNLRDYFSNKSSLSFEVKGWAIRNTTNKVNVYIEELTDEKISEFKNEVLDSDIIDFINLPKDSGSRENVKDNHSSENELAAGDSTQAQISSTTLYSGSSIECGLYEMSIGFPAKYQTPGGSYQYGFVTAGHSTSSGAAMKTTYGTTVGTVTKYVYSSSSGCDFAFVHLNSNAVMGSTVSSACGGSGTINNYYVTPVEGKTVYKTGNASNTTYGKVITTSMDYSAFFDGNTVNLKDLLMFQAYATNGDSGGIVYFKYNGTNTPVGITAAGYMGSSGTLVMKAENMVKYGVYPN